MLMIVIETTLVWCGVMMTLAAAGVCREARRGSWKSIAYFNAAAGIAFSTIYFAVGRLAG